MSVVPFNGLMLASFLAASSLVMLAFLIVTARRTSAQRRLEDLAKTGGANSDRTDVRSGRAPEETSPATMVVPRRIDRRTGRRIRRGEEKKGLRERLTQAGFYKLRAAKFFLVLRVALMIAPIVAGIAISRMGLISLTQGLVFGGLAGLLGTLAPVFWLDRVKRTRQVKIRRALPDALDVMVICLEGGLSLSGSFSRVARELATAHPMLAVEFNIVERQIQMGRTTGEAVRGLADRFDLEELRSMSSVISQAERVGASIAKALQVFADTLRQKRHQRAEEMAHAASVKLLFPTIIFIFPGIFVVLLGPAAIQVYQQLINGALR